MIKYSHWSFITIRTYMYIWLLLIASSIAVSVLLVVVRFLIVQSVQMIRLRMEKSWYICAIKGIPVLNLLLNIKTYSFSTVLNIQTSICINTVEHLRLPHLLLGPRLRATEPPVTKPPTVTPTTPTTRIPQRCPTNINKYVIRDREKVRAEWNMPTKSGYIRMASVVGVGVHKTIIPIPGSKSHCTFVITVEGMSL